MRAAGAVASCRARLRVRRAWLVGSAAVSMLAAGLAATLVQNPARATALAGGAALYGGLLLVAVLAGGWMGGELRSGTLDFWAQTPTSPVLALAGRFGAVAGTALALAALLAVGVSGILLAAGESVGGTRLLAGVPGMLLLHLIFLVLLWAAAGWGVVGDGWAALLLTVALGALELVARLRPSWLGPAAAVADLIGLPLDDVGLSAALLSGRGGGSGPALLRVAGWMAGWAAVGLIGLQRRCSWPPRSQPSS